MTLSHPHSQVLYQKCFISKHCNYTNLGLSALWVEFLSLGVSLLSVFQHIHREDYCSALQKYPDACLRRLWRGNHAPGTGIPSIAGAATALVPQQYNLDVPTLILCLLCFPAFSLTCLHLWSLLNKKMRAVLDYSKSKRKQGIKLEFWEYAAIAKPDCLEVHSYSHDPALFVEFSLQEIPRYGDFDLSLYILSVLFPDLHGFFHGLNVIRLCDNCFKLLTVEEAFANLC